MKECEEEIELLSQLVKILKYQECCELILQKDVKDSHLMLCKNGLCWYHEGLIKGCHSVMELSLGVVIEVSVDSHALLRVNGEIVNGIEHNQVLDLSDDGERWEGDVLNDEPYGWGVLYDSENRMVYEGFRIGEVNVCYGRSYYSDIGVIEYKGEWCGGQRRGRGVQYDRSGNTVFDGEWMDDEQLSKRVVLNEENQCLHNRIEELIVIDESCNGREWSVLDLSFMPNLQVLEVGNECFVNVNEVKLVGLNRLERVVIGDDCFIRSTEYNPNRHFYLKDCERVRELKMGRYSFCDYSVCEIENVPSLEVIEMGKMDDEGDIFLYASLELKGVSRRMR